MYSYVCPAAKAYTATLPCDPRMIGTNGFIPAATVLEPSSVANILILPTHCR